MASPTAPPDPANQANTLPSRHRSGYLSPRIPPPSICAARSVQRKVQGRSTGSGAMTDHEQQRRRGQFLQRGKGAQDIWDREIASPNGPLPGAVLDVLEHDDGWSDTRSTCPADQRATSTRPRPPSRRRGPAAWVGGGRLRRQRCGALGLPAAPPPAWHHGLRPMSVGSRRGQQASAGRQSHACRGGGAGGVVLQCAGVLGILFAEWAAVRVEPRVGVVAAVRGGGPGLDLGGRPGRAGAGQFPAHGRSRAGRRDARAQGHRRFGGGVSRTADADGLATSGPLRRAASCGAVCGDIPHRRGQHPALRAAGAHAEASDPGEFGGGGLAADPAAARTTPDRACARRRLLHSRGGRHARRW